MSNYQTILYQVDTGVATITLNRPDRLNAFTIELMREIATAVKGAGRDKSVRAVLLTGAGKAFCAGQDLKENSGPKQPNDTYNRLTKLYKPMIEQICTIEKPVIGALNGVAAGAGASLALACDLRIMSSKAFLLQAFSNIALVPDAGSTWFLTRQVGYSRAYEIAIEGERISAERCLELGLTNRITEPDGFMDEANAWAEKLAQRPTYALGLTKRAMNRAMNSTLSEAIEYEAHLQQLAVESADHSEGTTAFMEKRAPVFQGN